MTMDRDDMNNMNGDVSSGASTSGETIQGSVKDTAASVLSQAKEKLADVTEPLKDKAVETAQAQKDVGADQLGIVARAVHGAAQELETDMPSFATYIHDTGKWLEEAAIDVRNSNLEQLAGNLGQFARRQPAMMFGGAVLAGLALSRFLKSSAPTNTGGSSGGPRV